MDQERTHFDINKVSLAGLLITLGIIFGDIGTSPLYVMKAIIGEEPIHEYVVLGAISCVFWTLTLQTTIKYVIITLRADNKGEGGIFSLYALIRKSKSKWLFIPAIIGGSTLLADGMITPPVSVSSAIEGLRVIHPEVQTVKIVLIILSALFFIQQFGSNFIGNFFGPIMLVWFSMLGILGSIQLLENPEVLEAINPYYAYQILSLHPEGFWILGAVFLCTTGAEALYSDLGHCGRKNVRIAWIFVKLMLLLNYFGQGAWLLTQTGLLLDNNNPFFAIMPEAFLLTGIVIATCATVIASQALISGSFTLINEAMRLNFWPKAWVSHPTNHKGQLYIPSINWMLYAGCVFIVLYFQESAEMEAAYGLAIVLTMLMTSILLVSYLRFYRFPRLLIYACILIYGILELAFLVANLKKFSHGGWITIMIGFVIMSIMFIWYKSRKIRNRYLEFIKIDDWVPRMKDLSEDTSISKLATNLVYMTSANKKDEIESKIMYSIFQKHPKRADMYWFVHVDVMDEPYGTEYQVTEYLNKRIIRVDFYLGFREAPKVNTLFKKVLEDLAANQEIDMISRYSSLRKYKFIGDFNFVVIEKILSYENQLPFLEKIIMRFYILLKRLSLSEAKAFGLDASNVTVERLPLIVTPFKNLPLKRITDK